MDEAVAEIWAATALLSIFSLSGINLPLLRIRIANIEVIYELHNSSI